MVKGCRRINNVRAVTFAESNLGERPSPRYHPTMEMLRNLALRKKEASTSQRLLPAAVSSSAIPSSVGVEVFQNHWRQALTIIKRSAVLDKNGLVYRAL